jgi:cell division protein FtsI/penicillin-binding protein 2
MAFGQGVSVTPLAMIRYYSAIANGGLLMQPRIVHAVYDQQGNLVKTMGAHAVRRVFSEKIAATLRAFLRAVVVSGTGNPSAHVDGYTTAGKTGTAQMAIGGGYPEGYYASSFIGMIPYEHPRYVILVKIEHPIGAYYGGVVAAPAFTEIARAAMLHAGVLPETIAGAKTKPHG